MSNRERRKYYQQLAIKRLGETRINNNGSKMWIVDYKNATDITVRFENGYICKTRYGEFIRGKVSNPYDRTVYNIGYLGEGKYKTYNNEKVTPQYQTWKDMLKRCYSIKEIEKYPTYKKCSVCEEWHNFQNFAKWYDENYYEIECQRMCLDKDILCKGNTIYAPETCVFVPNNINTLFINCKSKRGSLPIGITYDKKNNNYQAKCSMGNGKSKHLGKFTSVEDAFNCYKKNKELIIKEIANQYKNLIPQKVYEAMMNYVVELDD